jgi:DNA polymerase sigma
VYNPALLYHLDQVGEMSAGTIKVDITINIEGVTSVGYESTVLMREWISMMPILQKLVLLLKYLLSYHGYNSNFTGGIGSYCLFVMVAAYMKDNAKEKEGNEAKEFLNILKWYGEEFDNLNNSVWLREEGNCFISQ